MKKEDENDEQFYSTEVIQRCRLCDDKEAYRLHLEESHLKEIEVLNAKIEDLTEERNQLASELKRYRPKEYVVEDIIAHRKTRGGRKFLIRWKGSDSSHDSWLLKENLSCPQILKEYLETNNLQ